MRKTGLIGVTALAAVLFTGAAGCRTTLVDPATVRSISVTWIPDHGLRNAPLEFTVAETLTGIFIGRLNASEPIDAVWNTDAPLYEGRYEFTVYKKDGGRSRFRLDGDSVIRDLDGNKYYQNKDLHLFIYRNLFLEFIRRKIKLQ